MLRRGITMTAVLLLSATIPAAAEEVSFPDVVGTTHEAAIVAIVEEGVASGYTDGRFGPADPVTRGQMATFLARALDLPPATDESFPDINGHTHEASIRALAASGITGGFADGTFRPNATVIRGQMATFLTRGFELDPDDTVRFTDIRDTTHEDGINAVAGAGIAGGFLDGTFQPGEPVTRGQMATFLARSLDLVDRAVPPDPAPEPPPAPVPSPSPAPRLPLAPSGTTFGNGVHTDLAPGTYRAGASDGCYWARLSGFGGTLDEIIANEFTFVSTIATIAASDRGFESTACTRWRAVQDTYPERPSRSFGDGSYVVGRHIEPGTYRAGASDGCYWARLSGFGGTLDEIIANEFTFDSTVVTIGAGDLGFQSEGCGSWSRN